METRLAQLEGEMRAEFRKQESTIKGLQQEIKQKENDLARLKSEITELKCPNPYFNGDRKAYEHWKECLLAQIEDDPDWFDSEDRKISHLMRHVTGLAFDVLGKKYCHGARQKARENQETLTFQAALSELDFIFRCIDPLEATSELQALHMTEEEEFPDFFPKFMALINRGAYTSRGNSDQAGEQRKLSELSFCFDDMRFRTGVASRLSPGSTFEEYVDECFRFASLWKTSPWSSETHSPASSTQGSSGRMAEDVTE